MFSSDQFSSSSSSSAPSWVVRESWNKTSGGTTTFWVGFELLLKEHGLGFSERRALGLSSVQDRRLVRGTST